MLAAAAVLTAIGCRDQRPCNESTVMLNITLAGRALGAEEIFVQVSVDGSAVPTMPVMRPAGQNKGSIEVVLGSRYKIGGQLAMVVSARQASGVLAEARIMETLAPGCTVRDVMLGETPDASDVGDARDGRDGAIDTRDGGPPDLPPDGPLPIDVPPDLPIDLPPDCRPICRPT